MWDELFNSTSVVPKDTMEELKEYYKETNSFFGLLKKCEVVAKKYNLNPDYLHTVVMDTVAEEY